MVGRAGVGDGGAAAINLPPPSSASSSRDDAGADGTHLQVGGARMWAGCDLAGVVQPTGAAAFLDLRSANSQGCSSRPPARAIIHMRLSAPSIFPLSCIAVCGDMCSVQWPWRTPMLCRYAPLACPARMLLTPVSRQGVWFMLATTVSRLRLPRQRAHAVHFIVRRCTRRVWPRHFRLPADYRWQRWLMAPQRPPRRWVRSARRLTRAGGEAGLRLVPTPAPARLAAPADAAAA